uniref:Uncharacterized protein n=1 Tax=Pithovirus LCPAC406 TaxID=2506599 RepID=A0A481ZCQ6_9VIRU|nr:MAG: hypothetical protein LCPAC406_00020 [Pithovirus LCPAC406]
MNFKTLLLHFTYFIKLENWFIMQMIDDLEKLMNELGIQDRRSAVAD